MSVPKRALRWEASSPMRWPVVESNRGLRLPPAESLVSMIFSVPKIGFVPCRYKFQAKLHDLFLLKLTMQPFDR